MPYITQDARDAIDSGEIPLTAGELNYLLTVTVLEYLEFNGRSYSSMNDVIGALEACKLEFYRRHVAPYEDEKIAENGDVN
jgi:hypothetical protein